MTKEQQMVEDVMEMEAVARAIMLERVKYGWTFGKRRKVMAIDLQMARAAITALRAHLDPSSGKV